MSVTPSTTRALEDAMFAPHDCRLDTGPGILYTSNFANQWMEAEV